MSKMTALVRLFFSICCSTVMVMFIGCDNSQIMIIKKQIDVLKNPYPMNYPSSNPMQNSVIDVLSKGERVKILGHIYGKDYLVYKVRLGNGRIGYVIYIEDAFEVISKQEDHGIR